MSKIGRLSGLCLSLLLIVSACKTGEKLGGAEPFKKRSAKYLVGKLNSQKIDYEWFSAKTKVNIETEDQKVALVSDIRIRKDSVIWMTFKKIGIEGARVQVTPESFQIINHLERNYREEPFSALADQFNIDLAFEELQNLITGNPIRLEENDAYEVSLDQSNERYIMSQNMDGMHLDMHLNTTYQIEALEGQMDENMLTANFSDYQTINDKYHYAFKKDILLESEATGEASFLFNFQKVELDVPQRINFKVPKSYTKVTE